eukprot:403356604
MPKLTRQPKKDKKHQQYKSRAELSPETSPLNFVQIKSNFIVKYRQVQQPIRYFDEDYIENSYFIINQAFNLNWKKLISCGLLRNQTNNESEFRSQLKDFKSLFGYQQHLSEYYTDQPIKEEVDEVGSENIVNQVNDADYDHGISALNIVISEQIQHQLKQGKFRETLSSKREQYMYSMIPMILKKTIQENSILRSLVNLKLAQEKKLNVFLSQVQQKVQVFRSLIMQQKTYKSQLDQEVQKKQEERKIFQDFVMMQRNDFECIGYKVILRILLQSSPNFKKYKCVQDRYLNVNDHPIQIDFHDAFRENFQPRFIKNLVCKDIGLTITVDELLFMRIIKEFKVIKKKISLQSGKQESDIFLKYPKLINQVIFEYRNIISVRPAIHAITLDY